MSVHEVFGNELFWAGPWVAVDTSLMCETFWCRWYLLALTKGRVAIGDRIRVSKTRKEFRDFEHGPKVVASAGLAALYQWLSELLRCCAAIISLWIPRAQEAKVM